METALQQRLVGAIVLVALGVIFIPALLDGSGYKSRHARSVDIPERPAFAPLSQDRVKPIPTPVDKKLAQVKQQAKVKAKAVDKPVNKPANEQSWMLQVGSFSSRKNADKYRDELRKKGYKAQVIAETSKGKTIYTVRIGPDLSKSRMEKLRKKLKKQGIDGYIVSRG